MVRRNFYDRRFVIGLLDLSLINQLRFERKSTTTGGLRAKNTVIMQICCNKCA